MKQNSMKPSNTRLATFNRHIMEAIFDFHSFYPFTSSNLLLKIIFLFSFDALNSERYEQIKLLELNP